MRILLAGTILSAAIGLAGCIEHRPDDETAVEETPVEQPKPRFNKKQLQGLRVYEGTIPCADCSGIYQRLALKGDTIGIFRLTETYRNATENGDGVIVTTGSWKRYAIKRGGMTITRYYLSENSFGDSSRVQRYAVYDNKILQLDINGDSIESPESYALKLVKYIK